MKLFKQKNTYNEMFSLGFIKKVVSLHPSKYAEKSNDNEDNIRNLDFVEVIQGHSNLQIWVDQDWNLRFCSSWRTNRRITLDLIQTDFEKLFGTKVDLVRVRDKMNQLLKPRIIKEGIYV